MVVVGTGVAGTSCALELKRVGRFDVLLIAAEETCKDATLVSKITPHLEQFYATEKGLEDVSSSVRVRRGVASGLDVERKALLLRDGTSIKYKKLCICTGARAKKILEHPRVLTIRDTDSVKKLCTCLKDARKVLLVGNGGIALEIASNVQNVHVLWAVKHGHIGDAFFDKDAADFLIQCLQKERSSPSILPPREKWEPMQSKQRASVCQGGHAAGPRWYECLQEERRVSSGADSFRLEIVRDAEVEGIQVQPETSDWPLVATLTNGDRHEVDYIISATGVLPNTEWIPDEICKKGNKGAILVNRRMESSLEDVYAAGDVVECDHSWMVEGNHWFQMRIWSQAKQMGCHAAQCMVGIGNELALGFNFELFTHITRFCGQKVVLLGLYNGQKHDCKNKEDMISYSRSDDPWELGGNACFIRVLLYQGKMQGAVLIGDTGMEEVFENLILDQLDLSHYGPALLDPGIDLGEIFD